jgi:hypothetical protein
MLTLLVLMHIMHAAIVQVVNCSEEMLHCLGTG